MKNNESVNLINSLATIVTATTYLLLPVFFLTITTDFFSFPKQLLIIFASLLLFMLWGIRSLIEKRVTILLNPLNLPVLLFGTIAILSTIFSLSQQESLLLSVPVALTCLFFFATINFIQDKSTFSVVLTSLIIGSAISAIISILSYFKIYALPFAQTHNQEFNTFGSSVQYIAFLTPLLILCIASLATLLKNGKINSITKSYNSLLQLISAIIFGSALTIAGIQIITLPQKPILLPFNSGFQIAFATISQESSRLVQNLLLGSGYGTFSQDFTRYITPEFNRYSFWNLNFSFSSSYALELLATIGVLGLFAFAFIFVNFLRTRRSFINPLFLSVVSVFILSIVIPFSFALIFLLFGLLALYIAHLNIQNSKHIDNVSINFMASNQGLFSVQDETKRSKENIALPFIVFAASIALTLFILFFLTGGNGAPRKGYVALINSDIKFAKSFSPAALQNGIESYNLQTEAIAEYPYRSDYYRIFSQVNLVLASNILQAQQPNTNPSPEVQQNILGLLQQSINSARQSVTLSPLTSINWQNLGQIYRNLIGVGENAEQFAIASYNQAITLNPSNPALRIELGGIYYQLQQWDLAQQQFLIATQLKSDYANAYYNLGKSYEQKGDLASALQQFQIVKQLVANDNANLDTISKEITAVEAKIGEQAGENPQTVDPSDDNSPLGVPQPRADFPDQDPKVTIPEPPLDGNASKSAE